MVTVGYTSLSLMLPVPVSVSVHMRVLRWVRYAQANREGLRTFDCASPIVATAKVCVSPFVPVKVSGAVFRRVVGAGLRCIVGECGCDCKATCYGVVEGDGEGDIFAFFSAGVIDSYPRTVRLTWHWPSVVVVESCDMMALPSVVGC